MKGFGRVLALGVALSAMPYLTGAHPLFAAAFGVMAGVLLSVMLAGAFSPPAVAFGALGAVTVAAVSPFSVAIAGALFVAFCYGARALRARTLVAGVVALAAAFLTGGGATWIVWSYADAGWVLRGSSVIVAALLTAVPLLVAVDDRLAHRLRSLAGRSAGVLRLRLLRGVVLRRRHLDADYRLSRGTRRRLERAYRALISTAASRIDSSASQHQVLDRRIDAYVSSLTRASRAAARAHALSTGIDDAILAELRLEREDLEAKAEALAEVA